MLLLEGEIERILDSVKRIVRQGRGSSLAHSMLSRLVPPSIGGAGLSHTMQRLLLVREFNFDSDVMSTPDWLWEQVRRCSPARVFGWRGFRAPGPGEWGGWEAGPGRGLGPGRVWRAEEREEGGQASGWGAFVNKPVSAE